MKRSLTCLGFFFLLSGFVALRAEDKIGDPLATATKEKPFVNSLGMEFVPVPGTKVLFCRWETRVKDFHAFAAAKKLKMEQPNFPQTDAHPVVNVSWEDAKAFCAWLSKKEGRTYRLPTDVEWSVAVELPVEKGETPEAKNLKIKDVYPWGAQWPPPRGAGNYGQDLKTDDFEFTSPVGSFSANSLGIYDLGGNVWEWCEDWNNAEKEFRVLRGGSWFNNGPAFLLSSNRDIDLPSYRNVNCGFRVVLVVPGG